MQLSYDMYFPKGQVGGIYDEGIREVNSFLAQGIVGIAKAVVRGTNKERQCVQAGTGVGQGALIFGVALNAYVLEQTAAGLVQWSDKMMVPVMRMGRVWVETNDAVVAGAVANFHLASGKWTDEVVATGIEAVPLLTPRFVTGTTGAGLAAIELHMV